MASLREKIAESADFLREGIGWLILYKRGRSWNSYEIHLDFDTEEICHEDIGDLKLALECDANAVALNGYFCGYLGEDMTICQLVRGVKVHYENGYNLLSEFIEANEPKRFPRPEPLPTDMRWSEIPASSQDEYNPYIFDGSMSIEDYEQMRKDIEKNEATNTQVLNEPFRKDSIVVIARKKSISTGKLKLLRKVPPKKLELYELSKKLNAVPCRTIKYC